MRTDDAIQAILARRIDEQRRSPGVVAGILSAGARRRFAHGAADAGRPVAEDTRFEIGLTGHNGGTFGMASSLSFDPGARLAVATLSNSTAETMNFAINLIRPEAPADDGPPFVARTAVALSAAELDRCVGRYRMGPDALALVTRDGGALVVKAPTTPPLAVQAESASAFFSNFVPLTLDFELPTEGVASAVLIHFAGQAIPAPRVAD